MSDFPHDCSLDQLGGRLWVRCKHRACLDGVLGRFAWSRSERVMTPDVIVECDWETAGRYLFEPRPRLMTGALEGVRVLVAKQGTRFKPWMSPHPPLPPLDVPPFAGRFVGLRGAAVVTPDGHKTLLLGEGGGATLDAAFELVERAGGRLLADGAVFLHRRTQLVEPFLTGRKRPGVNPGEDSGGDAARPVAGRPGMLTRVVVLSPGGASGVGLELLGEADAMRELLKHQLDIGADAEEVQAVVPHVARKQLNGLADAGLLVEPSGNGARAQDSFIEHYQLASYNYPFEDYFDPDWRDKEEKLLQHYDSLWAPRRA